MHNLLDSNYHVSWRSDHVCLSQRNFDHANPAHVVLDVGGVGYKLFIPTSLFSRLPQTGSTVLLHTSFIVRELWHALYGFLTSQERDVFEALMGVTGIGPKLALSLIGHLSIQQLHQAIVQEDISMICKVPGIGKKSSERLIIEMRDKVGSLLALDPGDLALQGTGIRKHRRSAMP